MTERFDRDQMLRLAASAVHKVDLLGPRGTTLCSMDEIDALAGVAVLSGLLPQPGQAADVNETPMFRTTRRPKP
jgi:hypothetical protein